MTILAPHTLSILQEIVQNHPHLHPCGQKSKPSLAWSPNHFVSLTVQNLQGVVTYQPQEYVFTAYAGTPLVEIEQMLAEQGQYLPFDPLLTAAGATLGGAVASNLAGPGRYRFGGLRDFILGVQFVDGAGQLVRSGGQVVKNAAGFDLPKFMVGSLGRFGVLTELSFKVFPAPQTYQTLQVRYATLPAALQALTLLDQSPLELYALDLQPHPAGFTLWLRIGGLASALPGRMTRLQQFLTTQNPPIQLEIWEDDQQHWQNFKALTWVNPAAYLLKIPLTPDQIEPLETDLPPACTRYYMAGGQVAWVATNQLEVLAAVLHQHGLTGLVVQGTTPQLIYGKPLDQTFSGRVKKALDPTGRFLPLL